MVETPVARIGQGARNEVVIDDDTVSTNHARLELVDGGWQLTDLNSRNGTYIDGIRLDPQTATPISDGALIRVGTVQFRFEVSSEADFEQARTSYVAPAEKESIAQRKSFRFPVWLLVVIVLVVAIVVFLLVGGGGESSSSAPLSISGAVGSPLEVDVDDGWLDDRWPDALRGRLSATNSAT